MYLNNAIPFFSIVLILLGLIHVNVSSTQSKQCFLDVVDVVPSRHVDVVSMVDSTRASMPVVIDYGYIDGNIWGLSRHLELVKGDLRVYVDQGGYLRVVSDLDLSRVPLKSWDVIAYPELSYGLKPWTPQIMPNMSDYLKLPLSVSNMPRVFSLVEYTVRNSSTAYNVAYDIWILRGNTPRTPGNGDVEVMIWLHRDGPGRQPLPAGSRVGVIEVPVLIDGFTVDVDFDIWIQQSIGHGWTYVAFVLVESLPGVEVGLDISLFIKKTMDILNLNPLEYYVFSIEFGFELFYNPRVVFDAAVYKYILAMGEEVDVDALTLITEKSRRLIAWLTPWGHRVDPDGFNEDFTPGVVVAYDIECGLCTDNLRQWLRRSLGYIESFRKRGFPIFINLFPEKYHPVWKWRGELVDIVLNEEVIDELKKIIGDGVGIYIGFSELRACLSSDGCLSNLISFYRYLRERFPAARLYYYGHLGEDVGKLIKLYSEGGLDIVGIDIWSYEYRDGKIYIPRLAIEKIKALGAIIPRSRLIIGETGLRLNDREAYIDPWDKHRPVVYDEDIDVVYFENILEHIRYEEVEPGFLGIWAWNDEIFAISIDQSVQEVIIKHAIEMKLTPRYMCDKRVPVTPTPGAYTTPTTPEHVSITTPRDIHEKTREVERGIGDIHLYIIAAIVIIAGVVFIALISATRRRT